MEFYRNVRLIVQRLRANANYLIIYSQGMKLVLPGYYPVTILPETYDHA